MAWRPRNLDAVPDQRFDRYRERAGRLTRGEEEETLRVMWLDDAESLRVRDEVFELDPPG